MTEQNKIEKKTIFIAAGGTGGHIFPGVHIAKAINQLADFEIEFIGAGRPVEQRIVGNSGYKLHTIKTVGLKSRGLSGLVEFVASFPKAFVDTWRLFGEKKPLVVVATGGYTGFFPFLVATIRGVPRWLHEAERRSGLANTVLSLVANKVSLAFDDAKMPFWAKTIYTGHPVRASLIDRARGFKVPDKPEHLLILGGSQGARAFDNLAIELAPVLTEQGLEVWHQCREENLSAVQAAYEKVGVEAKVVTFIDDLDSAYQWSDIIIARAGAGTVSEVAVVNKPVIFVPFPFAQGNHQQANAEVLVSSEKALMILEGPDFNSRLILAFKNLIEPKNYQAMSAKSAHGSKISAADQIAQGVLAIISANNP